MENEVSDSYTVIDVFADDKPGLLFVLAKTLVQLDLSSSYGEDWNPIRSGGWTCFM